jgi:hypothetical protein
MAAPFVRTSVPGIYRSARGASRCGAGSARARSTVPKSRYGLRDVPISKQLAQELWSHRAAAGSPADDAPLFPSRVGTHLNGENLLGRFLKPAVRRAGVPWAGFHTLRHTCASMLFRAGWNAKQVQVILGHHSPAFTLATCVHLIPDDLPEPRFPNAVAGSRTPLVGEQLALDEIVPTTPTR